MGNGERKGESEMGRGREGGRERGRCSINSVGVLHFFIIK